MRKDGEHERAEETRVLYVALTRARKRLVVLTTAPKQRSPWIEALRPWGYDVKSPPDDGELIADGTVLHRAPQLQPMSVRDDIVSEAGVQDAVAGYAEALDRLRASARPPLTAPSSHADEAPAEASADQRATPSNSVGRAMGKALGLVIHRVLELWPEGGEPSAVDALARSVATMTASTESVNPLKLQEETDALLSAFIASPLATQLAGADIVGRELPMLLRGDDGQVFRGTIDMLYRDPDGTLVIADFKTDRHTDETTMRQRYAPQLATYAKAVTQALNPTKPPRTELWLLRSGTRLPL